MSNVFPAILMAAAVGSIAAYAAILVVHSVSLGIGMNQSKKRLDYHWLDLIAYALMIGAWIAFSFVNIGKYDRFLLDPNDFGLFDQVLWNSLHGRLFENTFFYDAPILLGQRFSPILLALVPLYAVSANPHTIALVPPASIALAALPLYWLTRSRLGRPMGFVFVLGYFLSPGVQSLALSHFYETKIVLPVMMFAILFLLKRRYIPFFACLATALLCKEEIGFIAAGFGVYILANQRRLTLGIGLILFSLTWTGLLLFVVIPFFQGGSTYYYIGGASHNQYYGYLGSNLPEVVAAIVSQPEVVVQSLLIPDKVDAFAWLFFPLGLLPLLGPEITALAIPTLSYTLLSNLKSMYIVGSHHYAPLYPFLFAGALVGVERTIHLLRRIPSWKPLGLLRNHDIALGVTGAFLLVAMITAFIYSEDAPTDGNLIRDWRHMAAPMTPHDQLAHELARTIPLRASVMVQDELTGLVSERREVYRTLAIPCNGMADYLFLDRRRLWYNYRQSTWDMLIARPDYVTVGEQDGYVLRKRAPVEHPDRVEFDDGRLTYLGLTMPLANTVQGGQTISPTLAFQANRRMPASYSIEIILTDQQGHLWARNSERFCGGYFAFDRWRPGAIIAEPVPIQIPRTLPSGDYILSLELVDQQTAMPLVANAFGNAEQSEAIELTRLAIAKNKESITASDLVRTRQLDQPYFVDMAEMRLIGYKWMPARIKVGDLLPVGIYWRAREKPKGDYWVTVQLLDLAGRATVQEQSRPAHDTYPTTQWNAGEVLLDWHDLKVPVDLEPGEYRVVVSLRDLSANLEIGQATITTITLEE